MVSIWYTNGIHLVSIWYTNGIHLVSIWYTNGIRLVSIWYTNGIRLVSAWYTKRVFTGFFRNQQLFFIRVDGRFVAVIADVVVDFPVFNDNDASLEGDNKLLGNQQPCVVV